MKLILVTWHFPPINTIGAVRMGKLARYLVRAGHEVRIVTAERPEQDRSLPLEIDESWIIRTPYLDVDRALDRRPAGQARPMATAKDSGPAPLAKTPPAWRHRLGQLYRGLVFLPDRQVGWGRHLLPTLRRLVASFGPDLVMVSGPPFSPLLWTSLAMRRTGVPWLAELRDRWADDTYTEIPAWRRPFDHWLERRVLRTALGIVTVSKPWRSFYASKYGLPVATVMNGFDPEDFANLERTAEKGLPLRILHVGTIYRDRRDPRPLFDALIGGGFRPEEVRLVFHGRHLDWVRDLAVARGIERFVELHDPVPYRQALALQSKADILLLLQWNRSSEVGNVPGKLFEYFATGRPILGLGPEAGVPAQLIKERSAGLFANDPEAIAGYLRERLEEKRRTGRVEPLEATARRGLTRDEQYAGLEHFLEDLRVQALQASMIPRAFAAGPSGKTGGAM